MPFHIIQLTSLFGAIERISSLTAATAIWWIEDSQACPKNRNTESIEGLFL